MTSSKYNHLICQAWFRTRRMPFVFSFIHFRKNTHCMSLLCCFVLSNSSHGPMFNCLCSGTMASVCHAHWGDHRRSEATCLNTVVYVCSLTSWLANGSAHAQHNILLGALTSWAINSAASTGLQHQHASFGSLS